MEGLNIPLRVQVDLFNRVGIGGYIGKLGWRALHPDRLSRE